jgi:hypothetical protein
MLKRRSIPGPIFFWAGLAVLGGLQFFPPLIPALGIDQPSGRTVYGILLIVLVVGLFITQWQANSRKDDRADEDRRLLHLAVQGHATTQALVTSLEEARERKAALTSSGAVSLPTPSQSGDGSVTLTPGTGELSIEGFAPTVSVEAIDREIQEKEEALLKHLAEDESGWGAIASQIAAYQRNTQQATTSAAIQMQNVVNSGDTEFPTGENSKTR